MAFFFLLFNVKNKNVILNSYLLFNFENRQVPMTHPLLSLLTYIAVGNVTVTVCISWPLHCGVHYIKYICQDIADSAYLNVQFL
jgi:hypothetical protein